MKVVSFKDIVDMYCAYTSRPWDAFVLLHPIIL